MASQFKEFSIILYQKPTEDLLLNLGVIEFAYILHDVDLNLETGEIKKAHYHLYILLSKKKTFGGVFNIINKIMPNSTQPHLIASIESKSGFIRYLTHIDNPEKVKYAIEDIKSNFDIQCYFNLGISDNQFIYNVLNSQKLKTFRDIVNYSIECGKLDLVLKRAYFFKSLI